MFSFFRRQKPKDVIPSNSNVASVAGQPGGVHLQKNNDKSNTCDDASGPPTCKSKTETLSTDENSPRNSLTDAFNTQLYNNDLAVENTNNIMAPIAALRGKGRRKNQKYNNEDCVNKGQQQQNHKNNKQQNEKIGNDNPEPRQNIQQLSPKQNSAPIPEDRSKQNGATNNNSKNLTPPKHPERHKPLSYANILRRLDSVPPMSTPPEPEKRRHSVKPCSHVTIATSPKIQPQSTATGSPPNGSPTAFIRNSKAVKQSVDENEANTVTAAIKLKIDLNNCASDAAKSEKSVDKYVDGGDNNNSTALIVSINGKQDNNETDNNKEEKKNLVNQETQFQTQLAELSELLRKRDAEASDLRTQMEKLEHDIYVKSTGVDRLQAELTAAHKETEYVRQKLKHLQEDVQQYKQKNAEMVEELQNKTEEFKTFEESSKSRTLTLESSIQSLTTQLSSLESQLSSIRTERDQLQKLQESLQNEREEEKRIVQEALDAASAENESIRKRWEQDFEKLRTVNTDREQQMLDDFEWKLREVQATCKKRLEEKDKVMEAKIKDVQKDVDVKVKLAEQQMNEVKHLKSYEAEVTQLRGLTHDQQHSLRLMSSRVEELRSSEQNLREEITRLQSCIETEKFKHQQLIIKHEKDLSDKERALQIRLEKQRGEVATQWEQKLRQECARLTTELEQMHNDEKQLAVELVKVQKDREFDTVKDQFERKLRYHADEIEHLKSTLNKKENKFQNEIERLHTNTDRDIIELRRELDKAEMMYHERIEKIIAQHEEELDRINEEAEKKLKELEQNCQMQVSSMRTTLELVKEQAAREAEEKIQRLKDEHERAQDELWQRLTNEKEKEIERIEKEYKQKFEKIKEQFTIVQKSHQTKELELIGHIDKLKSDISNKCNTIEGLQGNVDTLNGGVQVLRQEIANQDEVITKVKTDAEQKIGELQHALKVERDHLQVEREEHIEEITHIQKQAQQQMEQLQKRCQCLTKLFEEMRARYDRRESRPEDVNQISDLRVVIAEQERDIAMLNEEKRYFQMKLMENSSSNKKKEINNTIKEETASDNSNSSCSTSNNSTTESEEEEEEEEEEEMDSTAIPG